MSSTPRVHRCRARKRKGRAVAQIEYDRICVPEMLVSNGLLAEWDTENPEAIDRAIEVLLELECTLVGETRFSFVYRR